MAKFFFILISLAFINVKAQLPSYYNRPLDYGEPSSDYNPNPSPYSPNTGYGPSISYQQEQELQRQQALNAYQQQASIAANPSNLPTQPAQPDESYAPLPRDTSNIYGQNPSLSYRPQSLPAINYQPNSQPALPTYDPQSQDNNYLAAQQAAAQQAAQQQAAQQAAAQQAAAQQAAAQQAARENAARQAAARESELARYAEAMRQAEAARQIEANKQADAARQAEAGRQAEAKRQAEINRQAALIAQQQREAAIAIQRQREAAIAIQNQRDAAAAQQRYNQQAANSNSAPAPSYNYNQFKPSSPTTTEAPKVIHRPAAIHYASIGQELNGDYTFGYHTGQGDKDNSFREEQRLPDGTVKGAYGYVDASGKKHIIKYTAGKDGFKVEGDVNPDIAAASQAKLPALEENTTPASYQAPYQPSSPPSYQSAPAPTQSYQPEPTRNYQAPASALRSSVAPQNSIPYQSPSSEVASTYQAPIQRQQYNLPASRPYQPLSAAPASSQLVAAAASAYPTSSRLSSKAVRKLMQSKYNQPLVTSGIDTSASAAVSSSMAPEPVKLKNNLPVQIIRQPPPAVPNYNPINVRRARSQNRTPQMKPAYNSGIETSASSSKISIEPLRRNDVESTQKVSSPLSFPALAMQSFLSRIK